MMEMFPYFMARTLTCLFFHRDGVGLTAKTKREELFFSSHIDLKDWLPSNAAIMGHALNGPLNMLAKRGLDLRLSYEEDTALMQLALGEPPTSFLPDVKETWNAFDRLTTALIGRGLYPVYKQALMPAMKQAIFIGLDGMPELNVKEKI